MSHHEPTPNEGESRLTAPRILTIAGLLVGTLIVMAFLAVGVAAFTSPGCGNCHLKGTFHTETQRLAHASLECGRCHGGPNVGTRLNFGSQQVFGMVLKVTDIDPTLSEVPSVTCRSCHASQLKKPVDADGLRIVHEACAVGRDCTACHSPVAHGTAVSWPRTPSMELCYECHGTKKAPSAACDQCHTRRLPSERVRTGSFRVTHGPQYEVTHGMGSMNTCSACHESSKCQKCHGPGLPHSGDFVVEHGPVAQAETATCTSCHKESFCSDCHGFQMPHPKSFITDHGPISEREGEASCFKCHAKNDCASCHESHIHPTTIEQLESLGVRPKTGGGD